MRIFVRVVDEIETGGKRNEYEKQTETLHKARKVVARAMQSLAHYCHTDQQRGEDESRRKR